MPAMSPTMEKGGVTEWKFKEGDVFNSGDVLLEVETDKAQIDVEAQDAGIVAKILVQNGAKDIPVGQPIAILADEGDDLATLEMPDVSSSPETVKVETPAPAPAPKKEASSIPATDITNAAASASQVFFPSVASLLLENKISREDAIAKIPSTGPNGRLLKGDVLSYLGKISKEAPSTVAAFIKSNSKLDLSNIEKHTIAPKVVEEAVAPKNVVAAAPQKPKLEPIVKTFSLDHLLEFQEEAIAQGAKHFSLRQYIEGASKRAEAYAYQTHAKSSDYYDPLFEDLLAQPSSVERFTVKLDIPPVKPAQRNFASVNPLDLAEELFGGASSDVSSTSASAQGDIIVTLTLKKVADAKEKAQLYLSQLEKYLNV